MDWRRAPFFRIVSKESYNKVSGVTWNLISLVLLACGAICWLAKASVMSVCVVTIGLAATAMAIHHSAQVHRRISGLVDMSRTSRATLQMLDLVAARLASLDHRTSNTHPVTLLPTREQLLASITADLEAEDGAHVLGLLHFIEFDQLAAFDDQSAHFALSQIAERITGAVQARHLVSQVDRATFAIWFGGEDARQELEAIAYVARQQIALCETVLTPTIRFSLARFPQDGGSAQQLLARSTADLTRSLSNPTLKPEPASAQSFRERFSLEQDLTRAIEQEQLTMVFQPVIDASAGRLVGAEALLRWDHPTLGPVSPARFIPMVERLHLSDRYGLWVLNAACREAARWRAEGLGELRMAVNLSAQQVLDPALEAKVERTLVRHGLTASALELELTETAAMADADRTLQLFTHLRHKGIGLAIDDFGTGYSSLSYLKKLPFTKLKIDREFVTDVDRLYDSRAICKALIELGRGLGLTVLAEGVETRDEVDALLTLGCALFQGFHFSKPLSGDAFLAFARQAAPGTAHTILGPS